MTDTFAKKAGIPVEEKYATLTEEVEILKDGAINKKQITEVTGVLVRENLPPFSIYTKDGLKIDVPAIPMSELMEAYKRDNARRQRISDERASKGFLNEIYVKFPKRKNKMEDQLRKERPYLCDCFERYIRGPEGQNCPQNVNLDFVRNSLYCFFDEYRSLINDHLDLSALMRSAIKHGIHFRFYGINKPADANACYSHDEEAIEFNCQNYPNASNKWAHNTLAHELCHYAMDDQGKQGFFSTFFESDFGKAWAELMIAYAFRFDKKWNKVFEERKKKEKDIWETFWANKRISEEYHNILGSKSYTTQNAVYGELFCRTIGILASLEYHSSGVFKVGDKTINAFAFFTSFNDARRIGPNLVCLLAEADANNDKAQYNTILKTLKKFKVSEKLLQSIGDSRVLKERIIDKNTYTAEENNLFVTSNTTMITLFNQNKENFFSMLDDEIKKNQISDNVMDKIETSSLYQTLARETVTRTAVPTVEMAEDSKSKEKKLIVKNETVPEIEGEDTKGIPNKMKVPTEKIEKSAQQKILEIRKNRRDERKKNGQLDKEETLRHELAQKLYDIWKQPGSKKTANLKEEKELVEKIKKAIVSDKAIQNLKEQLVLLEKEKKSSSPTEKSKKDLILDRMETSLDKLIEITLLFESKKRAEELQKKSLEKLAQKGK